MIPYVPAKPAAYIPIVDLAGTFGGDDATREAASWEIHKAARDTGFFYIENHGIDPHLIDEAFAAARRFFELPEGKKREVVVSNMPRGMLRGWDPMLAQTLDDGSPSDLKESFYLARDLGPDHPLVRAKLPNHGPNQWPRDLAGFRSAVEAYYEPMCDLGRHLMRLLALSLSLEESYFDAAFREPAATLRLLRYPPQPARAAVNQIGAGAHTDYGAITLLAQDECGGLEVENAAGEWLRATPVRGTFVVNLGDMVKRWTNDLYHSNMHRVRNAHPDRDRYSMALFFNPAFHTRVECVPTCRPGTGEPSYPPCTAGDHVAEMIRRSYGLSAG
jgi:isopenicillin N synthase-like dioxygenase